VGSATEGSTGNGKYFLLLIFAARRNTKPGLCYRTSVRLSFCRACIVSPSFRTAAVYIKSKTDF